MSGPAVPAAALEHIGVALPFGTQLDYCFSRTARRLSHSISRFILHGQQSAPVMSWRRDDPVSNLARREWPRWRRHAAARSENHLDG